MPEHDARNTDEQVDPAFRKLLAWLRENLNDWQLYVQVENEGRTQTVFLENPADGQYRHFLLCNGNYRLRSPETPQARADFLRMTLS
jgi:hypothetical protein